MPTIRERAGRWQALVRIKRGGVLIHAETETFDTEALARDWGRRVEERIKRDGVAARRSSKTTFGALIARYRTVRNEARPMGRSMEGDMDMLEATLGARPLSDMDTPVWVEFARTRRASGAGPATVLHNLSIARSVLNAAKPMFGLDASGAHVSEAIRSMASIGLVAPANKRARRPTAAELQRLDKEFKRTMEYPSTVVTMAPLVALAVALPRRLGELCHMRWEDYKDGIIFLRDTKHPRLVRNETVPVPPAARAIIEALPVIDEFMLPYKSPSVSRAFDRACERVGIADLHFHDLRHEGICRLFELGLQIPEVALISGHLSWSTLKRYTHLRPQDVLEKLDARS